MVTAHLDVYAVVPTAGFGRRMRTEYPKQYLSIGDQTILERLMYALPAHPKVKRVVTAINPGDSRFTRLPLAGHPRTTTIGGGEERADSVLAGLKTTDGAQQVLVYDVARPYLHQDGLTRLLALGGTNHTGGIPVVPVCGTMKRVEPGKNVAAHTVDHSGLWYTLTPQFFPHELLRDCPTRTLDEGVTITDEVSALEYCDFHPQLIEGHTDNIKATRPEDLVLTELYLIRTIHQESIQCELDMALTYMPSAMKAQLSLVVYAFLTKKGCWRILMATWRSIR